MPVHPDRGGDWGGTTGGGGTAPTGKTGSTAPKLPAPTASLKTPSTARVLVKHGKGHPRGHLDVVVLTVRSSQTATVTLTGTLTLRAGRAGRRTISVPVMRGTVRGGVAKQFLIRLPRRVIAALERGAKESAVFRLTVSNANGTSHSAVKVLRVRMI